MGERFGRRRWDHAAVLARREGCRAVVATSDPYAAGFHPRMGADQMGWHASSSVGRRSE